MVNPFFDYNNEAEYRYIAMVIEVPTDVGEAYIVTAITKTGGNEGFMFGARETDFGWWQPTCMDTCVFSDAFAVKYPEIVDLATP
jgi:hypothetical protein